MATHLQLRCSGSESAVPQWSEQIVMAPSRFPSHCSIPISSSFGMPLENDLPRRALALGAVPQVPQHLMRCGRFDSVP